MTLTADTLPPIAAFDRDFALRRRRARIGWAVGSTLFFAAFLLSAQLGDFFKVTQVTLPDGTRADRWIVPAGIPRLGEYVAKTIPTLRLDSFWADFGEWFWRWKIWLRLLVETVLIAFMATSLGVIGGFALSFPAARNLAPNTWVLWFSRRYLEIARTVPDLVWALIFVFCFSVGPLAGVLAIALHATGALGKLYSEVNENIDMRPLEGVKAAGGSWFDQIRYGAVPQVLPNIISYTLLRFEINVRSSSIIGYVGAGGLGQEFREAMSLQEYTDLSALFLIIFLTVIAIDYGSEKLRHRIIDMGQAA
ncbi:MAG: phosphonate ABC transporter, permease protein PhnE [Confluentimicrobium sp.]|uniref:phosphonate ABC transporter, permease protein PhnE n=1 Tax=Actibacterium sp. TaxID=1872125 RepID=UPI00050F350C|nr:phosphonate ABC transporter, permease protein PhnE [Actibacterium sp.]KGB80710.1 phosphonate transporter [Rhodovulum sp. NI22]MBC57326.1 phosphonate ABC transporter, permease protein PhnE [Actibacterium sp.]MDY6859236.1 phosphonate ABC transporter, permease protein PhnE [Pseudomonadota bacterium]